MTKAILMASLLMIATLGLLAADPVAADDPTEWCDANVDLHGPGVYVFCKDIVCVGVGVNPYGCRPA